MIGYGTEGGEDYYLCTNSWGPAWGDNGYFKILVGDSALHNWGGWGCAPKL